MFSVKQLVLVKNNSENMFHDIDAVISSGMIKKNPHYAKYVYMRNVFWIIIFYCPVRLIFQLFIIMIITIIIIIIIIKH